MIQYTLKCHEGHETESWFQSSAAYETLANAGHLSCTVCGSTEISKALMAPKVSTSKEDEGVRTPMLANPNEDVARAIEDLREKVESNSDYVGKDFVKEARAMHLGDKPERAIYGEARLDQAKGLIEDGVPVLPLPFRPKKKLT